MEGGPKDAKAWNQRFGSALQCGGEGWAGMGGNLCAIGTRKDPLSPKLPFPALSWALPRLERAGSAQALEGQMFVPGM